MGFANAGTPDILQELCLMGDVLGFVQLGTWLLTSSDELDVDVDHNDAQHGIISSTRHIQTVVSRTISQLRSYERKFQRGFAGPDSSTTCPELHVVFRDCYLAARLLRKYLERTNMRENRLKRERHGLKAALASVWSKKRMNQQSQHLACIKEHIEDQSFTSIRSQVRPSIIKGSPGFFWLEPDDREIIMALSAGIATGLDQTEPSTQIRALCLLVSRAERPPSLERRPSVFSMASDISSSSHLSSVSHGSTNTCMSVYSDDYSEVSLSPLCCEGLSITHDRESSHRHDASEQVLRDLAVSRPSHSPSLDNATFRPYEETCREILEDPMNSFRLWLRNPHDHTQVYWINGPRGSGKSTFMGSIYNLLQRNSDLESPGTEETKFIIAKVIHPPTGNDCQQRSQAELYRSILHEVLTQDRRLVPLIFPREWSAAYCKLSGLTHPTAAPTKTKTPEEKPEPTWSMEQLKTAVNCLFTQDVTSFRACLLIDGLDKYADDAVNSLVRQITAARWTNVKCCISTQASPAFSAAFEGQPSLQMTDVTGAAMRQFALEQLGSHEAFLEMRGPDSRVLRQCVREIADAANGVFSWTRLAIATAMREHGRGDGMRELRNRIRGLPRCLEELEEYSILTARVTDRGHVGQAGLLAASPFRSYDVSPARGRLSEPASFMTVAKSVSIPPETTRRCWLSRPSRAS